MAVIQIKPDIYFVGAIHWDRKLFDELIPLPDGTSYNAYLIRGSEKIALIDTVDPATESQLLRNLNHLGVERIDYIVSNHAEQDHSGSIPKILELYPMAKVVTNQKCKAFLQDLLLIPDDKFVVIGDGERISLGNKTLEFIMTPWVHWPETMSTYLVEDKILFSCDFFGSHLATSELYAREGVRVYRAAKLYYAQIMMPYAKQVAKNLEKVSALDLEIIAPSHGPLYDKPSIVMETWREWTTGAPHNMAVIAYVSCITAPK